MKHIKRVLALIFAICTIVFAVQLSYNYEKEISKHIISSRNTVVIDAGHGGKDVGAIGIDGSKEKDINLDIALDLYDFLMVSGVNAVLTRDGDYQTYFVEKQRTKEDIYNRMDVVNSTSNSVLISVHQNHFDDEREWGTQVWYSANNEQSKVLADCILDSVKANLQPNNNRTNKESDDSYYLLYKAQAPSVMVECGFTSNSDENIKLQDADYQNDFAYSIMLGICKEV